MVPHCTGNAGTACLDCALVEQHDGGKFLHLRSQNLKYRKAQEKKKKNTGSPRGRSDRASYHTSVTPPSSQRPATVLSSNRSLAFHCYSYKYTVAAVQVDYDSTM